MVLLSTDLCYEATAARALRRRGKIRGPGGARRTSRRCLFSSRHPYVYTFTRRAWDDGTGRGREREKTPAFMRFPARFAAQHARQARRTRFAASR